MANDPFSNALSFLAEIEKYLRPEYKKYLVRLTKPSNLHKGKIKIKMDDGKNQEFVAFRSQHNDALGPFKGGIRFHQNVSESEVKALSLWMSIKCSVAGIPLGGGKGGIIVDPKKLSAEELERLSRAYARFIAPIIGEKKDVPAPDVNTNPQIMAWMLDEYEKIIGHKAPGTFTGKPLALGGSKGRTKATGYGGVLALKYLLDQLKKEKKTKWVDKPVSQITVAVQGFGNVGYFFAQIASDAGFKIVAASDSRSGIYVKDGLDPKATLACKTDNGSIEGCYCIDGQCSIHKGKTISNDELLELPVDILVPGALESVINEKNADKIKAKVIVEMANGPTTPQADEILTKKGVYIIPDVYANSGGVSVSYFEWAQNLGGYYWEEELVDERLAALMKSSFHNIWKRYSSLSKEFKNGISLRLAAYLLAVERILEAEKLRRP